MSLQTAHPLLYLHDNVSATAHAIADRTVVIFVESEGTRVGEAAERVYDVTGMLDASNWPADMRDENRQVLAYGVVRGLLTIEPAAGTGGCRVRINLPLQGAPAA